jgi:hypothetical protein
MANASTSARLDGPQRSIWPRTSATMWAAIGTPFRRTDRGQRSHIMTSSMRLACADCRACRGLRSGRVQHPAAQARECWPPPRVEPFQASLVGGEIGEPGGCVAPHRAARAAASHGDAAPRRSVRAARPGQRTRRHRPPPAPGVGCGIRSATRAAAATGSVGTGSCSSWRARPGCRPPRSPLAPTAGRRAALSAGATAHFADAGDRRARRRWRRGLRSWRRGWPTLLVPDRARRIPWLV